MSAFEATTVVVTPEVYTIEVAPAPLTVEVTPEAGVIVQPTATPVTVEVTPAEIEVRVGGTGEAGPPGAGLRITGSAATAADLPAGLTPDDAGTGYLTDDDGHLWVWDGTAWLDAGPIRGPTGLTGPAGADGLAVYSGTGAPSAGLGRVGETYIDVATGNVWMKS